jgi:protein TonB
MFKYILPLLIILPIFSFGQETIKVTTGNKKSYFSEVYYVLKSDNSIRHGNYQLFANKDKLVTNGFYKNGLKDSLWTEYENDGKTLKTKGNYLDDKKIGVWEYYDYNGELEQKYDYTKNEILYFKLSENQTNKEYKVINGTDTISTKLSRPPLFIGGSRLIFNALFKEVRYPDKAKKNKTEGTVLITFTIDINGKTSNHRVSKGIGDGCDEDALRVVKKFLNNWIPGILNEKAVNVEYSIPIKFNLS